MVPENTAPNAPPQIDTNIWLLMKTQSLDFDLRYTKEQLLQFVRWNKPQPADKADKLLRMVSMCCNFPISS